MEEVREERPAADITEETSENDAVQELNANRKILSGIKDELRVLLRSGEKQWREIGRLINRVREEKLYLYDSDIEIKTFTAWVKKFAKRENIGESCLWRYSNVVTFYDDVKEKTDGGESPLPDIYDAEIGPNTLYKISQICVGDDAKAASSIRGVSNGEISARELESMYQMIKKKQREDGKETIRRGPALREKEEKGSETGESGSGPEDNAERQQEEKYSDHTMNIAKMLAVLIRRNNHAWLPGYAGDGERNTLKRGQRYKVLTNVKIKDGENSVEPDALIVENLVEDKERFQYHQVKLAAEGKDLDCFDADSCQYFDFTWIATIPKSVSDVMGHDRFFLEKMGVLVIEGNEIKVVREANCNRYPEIMPTMAAVLRKVL